MKTLLILTSLVFLTGAAYAKPRPAMVENAKKFTVLVTNEGILGGGRGSGILLDAHHVITCMHMGESYKDEFFVYTYPFGAVYKARVDGVDSSNDLMFLVIEATVPVRVKPVFQTKVEDGEPVTIIGNALGSMKWLVGSGIISGRERDYLLTDALVQHGDSGGPWLNEKGEIVAISDWGLAGIPGVSGGISGEKIATTVDYYLHPEKLMQKLMEALFGVKPKAAKK